MRLFIPLFFFATLFAKPLVIVSVPPQKFILESICQDACDVTVIVPAGASPHTYEPSPKQLQYIADAALWFRIGESFEERLLPLFKGAVVDQREGIELLGCSCHGGADPHIWLSPVLLKQEARQICSALEKELGLDFYENLAVLDQKLDSLIEELNALSYPETILVSHPAFGYFCRDFDIEQLSIEVEGKEPSLKQTAALMEKARGLKKVFLQEQYSLRGGRRIAKELDLDILFVDPYAEDVVANLSHLGEVFSDTRS